jgi:hypothetical protein
MKKGKLTGKIFAIALVGLMIGTMLGGTLGSAGVALAAGGSSVSLHVPYFSQCDGRWGSDQMGTADCILGDYGNWTISCGCAVTCVAMVLNYYGVDADDLTYSDYSPNDTNPKDLNQWLRGNGGYSVNNITWDRVEVKDYSNAKERGIDFVEEERYDWGGGINAAKVSVITNELNSKHPVIVNVGGHWVVITGMNGDTFYINDPWYVEKTTLASYSNKIYGLRVYHGTPAGTVMPSGLYAGSSDPGLVYYYVGGNTWNTISSDEELGHAYAVLCLAEYRGHLYAGTTSAFGGYSGVGRVYRYDGEDTWTLVGDNMDGAVCSLAVYQGDLYAGTSWNGMKLYRYEGNPNWRQVIDSPIWSGTRSLYVSHDYLLMGDAGMDYFGHWDGSSFYTDLVDGGSCIYDYQDYGDSVYAAAYVGRMWRSSDGINWNLAPGFESYYDGNMWELEEFKDLLYMSYNNGELWASDGSERGTCVWTAPDGIISMTTDGYYLYFGTGGDAVGWGPESTGIANAYRYDGTVVTPISLEDEFKAGVQVLYTVRPSPISWYLCSPADMIVTDPDDLTISKDLNEIPGATYTEIDINADGDPDDVVNIPDRKIGDYLVTVIPEPGASPTDTYTLGVSAGGVTIVLAENVQIADIPSEGYIVRSTETEIMQIIPATIDFAPDVLNLETKGKYVTAYIELPTGYDVSQIDISSIRLNDTVPALTKPTEMGDYDSDSIPDLMVKFDRAAVQRALTGGEGVEVTITGEVAGIGFEGSDTISRVITPAPPGLTQWTRVSTPTTEDWVLAPDSVIVDYGVADGGDVAYAIVGEGEEATHLLESTDGAATWDGITTALEDVLEEGESINELLQVATDWEVPDFVAVALSLNDTTVHVFFSVDGGATFEDAGEVGDGGVYLSTVSDLEVSRGVYGKHDIAIGGMDDFGYAALFRCTVTGDAAGAWVDASEYDGWDDDGAFTSVLVTDILFAPSWADEDTILAVTVTGNSTANGYCDYWYGNVTLQSGTWGTTSSGWNEKADFEKAVIVKQNVYIPAWLMYKDARGIAGVTVPQDYAGDDPDSRYAWVWVNYYTEDTGSVGEVLRVRDDAVDSMDTQIVRMPWLTNVSYLGYINEGKAIAGMLAFADSEPLCEEDLLKECCEGVNVYRNDGIHNMEICCQHWEKACKPPTGNYGMAAFYVSDNKAYAVSLWGFFSPYDEDAWSVSFDDGDVWNQLSLIDTNIDYLSDVAVSPDCDKMMLVSVNEESGCGCDSVWLKAEDLPEAEDYSGKWMRTWCGQLENNHGLLRLAPEETNGDTVYLVDYGTDAIYWNDLETIGCWTRRSAAAVVDSIVDLAVRDESTIYALDENGDVGMSGDHGATPSWIEAVDSEVGTGYTIAVWGDYILVGGEDGDVSYSDDGGETFTALVDVTTSGSVTVAFDSYFDQNNTIYAALADAVDGNGIYRWVIGESDGWENLGAEDYACTGLVLNVPSGGKTETSADTGGILYASYVSGDTTGVARFLTPAEDVRHRRTKWDYLTKGLTSELFKMTPQALKICGCLTANMGSRLFAIDSSEYYDMEEGKTGTVWSFEH